jgi:predicted MFS family arabinose efflux permease
MERQAFFANIRTFVIGILVVATIAGVALSAGAVAALTGVTAAGTLVAHLITRWIANRE